jgi:imidazole glycerol-phosphate synthase subunit HisH
MKVAIVDYNAGNTASVRNALNRLRVDARLTDDPDLLRAADKVIFPGVGEASTAMQNLKAKRLDGVIQSLKQPFLGICLGMQLLCESTEENDTECLGLVPRRVKRFPAKEAKVPQIGWNRIAKLSSPLFSGVVDGSFVYFVHSYFVETGPETIASTDYAGEFTAGLRCENFYGVQFHPEKSGPVGQRILENFLSL